MRSFNSTRSTKGISSSYSKVLTALTVGLLLLGSSQLKPIKSSRPSSSNEHFQSILKQVMSSREQRLSQGYKEPVMVHVVPHSYNSEFIGAVEEYFEDEKQQLMQEHFDKVFNSVVVALSKDPTRTFTHYEVKHFANWYQR